MVSVGGAFQGIPIPNGLDRRSLYQSAHRAILTYAMPIVDLDQNLRLSLKDCKIKADNRRKYIGKLDVIAPDGGLVHIVMDTCGALGATPVVQLKFWVDF